MAARSAFQKRFNISTHVTLINDCHILSYYYYFFFQNTIINVWDTTWTRQSLLSLTSMISIKNQSLLEVPSKERSQDQIVCDSQGYSNTIWTSITMSVIMVEGSQSWTLSYIININQNIISRIKIIMNSLRLARILKS